MAWGDGDKTPGRGASGVSTDTVARTRARASINMGWGRVGAGRVTYRWVVSSRRCSRVEGRPACLEQQGGYASVHDPTSLHIECPTHTHHPGAGTSEYRHATTSSARMRQHVHVGVELDRRHIVQAVSSLAAIATLLSSTLCCHGSWVNVTAIASGDKQWWHCCMAASSRWTES